MESDMETTVVDFRIYFAKQIGVLRVVISSDLRVSICLNLISC